MPYIEKDRRDEIREAAIEDLSLSTPGELNYAITDLCDDYLLEKGQLSYSAINEVIGVLECAKQELYRRVAAPYEDGKRIDNGDVYYCLDL